MSPPCTSPASPLQPCSCYATATWEAQGTSVPTLCATENVEPTAKEVEDDEEAEEEEEEADGAVVERALTETAVSPSKAALGRKQRGRPTSVRSMLGAPAQSWAWPATPCPHLLAWATCVVHE
jgi:hypothetical protein